MKRRKNLQAGPIVKGTTTQFTKAYALNRSIIIITVSRATRRAPAVNWTSDSHSCQLYPRCNRPLPTISNGRGSVLQTLDATMKNLPPRNEPKPGLPGNSPPPSFGFLELCSVSVSSDRETSQVKYSAYPDLIAYTDSCQWPYFYKIIQFILKLRAPRIHNSIKGFKKLI